MGERTVSILLVDDDPDDVLLTQRALRKAGLVNPLHVVGDGELAIAYLAGRGEYADRDQYPLPSLILLDLYMPRKTGFEVLAWLRQQAALRHLLVVVLTSSKIPTDLQRAFTLGANSYLIKPLLPEALKDMLTMIGLALTMAPRILLVEDDLDDRELVQRELRGAFPNFELAVVGDTADILQAIEAGQFDLVITDFDIGKMNGLTVLYGVKARWPDRPVIMFTGTAGEEIAVEAMKVGLDDYILKTSQHFGRLGGSVRLALGRARARQAASEAESRYRSLFEGVPVGLFRTTEAGQILDANPALVQILGYPDHESVLALNLTDLYVDPEDRARWDAGIAKEGLVRDFETRLRRHDGAMIWVRGNTQAIRGANGGTMHFDGFVEDITERKRADKLARLNRDLRTISLCNQAMVRAADEEELLREICRTIAEVGGHRAAWVGFVAEGEQRRVRPVAVVGCEPERVDRHAMDLTDPAWATCPVALAIRTGAVQVIQNIPGNPPRCPWHEEAVRLGFGSSVSLPLKRDGRPFGALTIYSALPDAFDAEEVNLLTELANDLAYGIQAIRTRAAHERALAEIESLARFPNENPSPVMRVREDGVILYANAPSGRLLRLWGTGVGGRMPAEWSTRIREALETRTQEGLDLSCDDRIYSVIMAPIPEGGYVNLYGRDITDRKRAEEALLDRTKQLEAIRGVTAEITRELDLPSLLELIIRRAVELLGANSGTVRLWDEEAQLLIPVAWHGLGDWAKDQSRRLGEALSGTVAQRREGLIVNDYPMSPYANPAILEHVQINAMLAEPLIYRDRLLGALTVDIHGPGGSFTEKDQEVLRLFATQAAIAIENARLYEAIQQHAAELEQKVEERTRELAAANKQLQAASRHKSEFLANMSHELRTPLNSILGFSELLLEQTKDALSTKQTRFLTNIYTSGQHLLRLINDILDLSKVEAGKITLQPEALPVAQTLEDILVIGRGLANKKGQIIDVQIAPDLPPLPADPVRFKQILFNLLSNAVKFTPERGTITVRARRTQDAGSRKQQAEGPTHDESAPAACLLPPADWLEVAVADTGIGIKAEDLPRLFQEFVRLEAAQLQQTEGTGLGLALTKRLVELHGGRIWAASDGEGRGSTFTVLLPFTGPAG